MKIRGNTIGTPLKPEKNLVKATNLTAEEQAQARANIGADQVFIAEYGKTSFAEMDEAYSAGKVLLCRCDNKYLVPMYECVRGTSVSFYRVTATQIVNYFITKTGNWNNKILNLCDAKHKKLESQIQTLEERIAALESASGGGGVVFYLNGSAYEFERGMTWEQFVASGYNPTFVDEECCNEEREHFGTYYNTEDDVWHTSSCCGPSNGYLLIDGNIVWRSEEIIAGGRYYTSNDY